MRKYGGIVTVVVLSFSREMNFAIDHMNFAKTCCDIDCSVVAINGVLKLINVLALIGLRNEVTILIGSRDVGCVLVLLYSAPCTSTSKTRFYQQWAQKFHH